ncbi:MAG: hypothetical protein JSW41_03995 [Candidatus Aenigmatarchaeota archaeon]|nr:MAG: hypothetical protein JSW41_03995 [Candidatus Aenigmarchaeota archaeon]
MDKRLPERIREIKLKPIHSDNLFTEKEAETIWQAVLMHGLHPKVENMIERKLVMLSKDWFR